MPPPFPDPQFARRYAHPTSTFQLFERASVSVPTFQVLPSSDYGSFPEETASSQYGSFPDVLFPDTQAGSHSTAGQEYEQSGLTHLPALSSCRSVLSPTAALARDRPPRLRADASATTTLHHPGRARYSSLRTTAARQSRRNLAECKDTAASPGAGSGLTGMLEDYEDMGEPDATYIPTLRSSLSFGSTCEKAGAEDTASGEDVGLSPDAVDTPADRTTHNRDSDED